MLPVAATTKVMLPNTVASMPLRGWLAPSRRLCTARAPFAPDEMIELAHNLAADGLGAEYHAAIAVATSSIGAIANSV
jgi:hypothetical protein